MLVVRPLTFVRQLMRLMLVVRPLTFVRRFAA
jgi:hypothetical protein